MSHAIELDELRKDFRLSMQLGRRRALDGLSLSVRPGEIYGFLGPNGAGKTTSIKILVSLLRQDSGTATIFGAEPARGETRQQIGYLPESPTFYEHLTGREFLAFCGRLCGLRGAELRERSGPAARAGGPRPCG